MDKPASLVEQLSPREDQIATAFSDGESYNQIAERLCISPSTVRTHLTTIYRKLGVSSKLELHKVLTTTTAPDGPDPQYPALPDKPSIAVLAFENMSDDPEQEYFSDGITGGHVWSERYDGQLADVFDLQDEITGNVVASILTRVHLTAGETLERRQRPDLTVWELTMRAWHLLYDFSPESYAKAETFLAQALERDPDSPEAHMVRSVILYHSVILGFAKDPSGTAQQAYDFGRKATRLDDWNEYAHWALGLSCFALHRHDEAITALTRAVELNPNCSVAYGSLGTALGLVGRTDEAIARQEVAIRSNPLDPSIFFRFTGMATAHYLAGRFDTAAEWASKAVHRMPQWYLGHYVLIGSLCDVAKSPKLGPQSVNVSKPYRMHLQLFSTECLLKTKTRSNCCAAIWLMPACPTKQIALGTLNKKGGPKPAFSNSMVQ